MRVRKLATNALLAAALATILMPENAKAQTNVVFGLGQLPCTEILAMDAQIQQIIVGSLVSGAITVSINYHTMVSKDRVSSRVTNLEVDQAGQMVLNVCQASPRLTLGDATLQTISNLGR